MPSRVCTIEFFDALITIADLLLYNNIIIMPDNRFFTPFFKIPGLYQVYNIGGLHLIIIVVSAKRA